MKRSDLHDQIATLLEFRRELRAGAPIEIGALAGGFYVGTPTWEVPRGTVTGGGDEIAAALHELAAMGVRHVQLRFPSRSADELCDQMAAFGDQVAPLLHP